MKDPIWGEFASALQAITLGENIIRLPKSGSNVSIRSKLGFKEIGESASWYYIVKMPDGWTIKQDELEKESCDIFDQKGRKRGSISVILLNDVIVTAFAHFYRRYYGLVEEIGTDTTSAEANEKEQTEKGRALYILDRTNPNYKVRFCKCGRVVEDFMDSQDCINTALSMLDTILPGCNDVDNWDDNTLSAYQGYFDEFEICRCCKL